jgi:hypothetical protein
MLVALLPLLGVGAYGAVPQSLSRREFFAPGRKESFFAGTAYSALSTTGCRDRT